MVEPLLCTLPPGRHGLPREFIEANQRQRLLSGLAQAVCEKGYLGCTIGDVTRTARVSRRTFYDHFESKEEAGAALVELGSGFEAPAMNTGLGVMTVELVAMALAGDPKHAVAAASNAADRAREIGNSVAEGARSE